MNTRLILEEAKERTKSQLKNNIKFWIKWGLSILFFLLSVISFMSVIVITSIKQTVSTEAIEESKEITSSIVSKTNMFFDKMLYNKYVKRSC